MVTAGPFVLQLLIDSLVKETTITPWHSSLAFPVFKVVIDNFLPVIDSPFHCHDIFNPPIPSVYQWRSAKVYFCPSKYPPQSGFSKNGPFSELYGDLMRSAMDSGICVYSNGSTSHAIGASRRICCQNGKVYSGKKLKNKQSNASTINYRNQSFVNDRVINARPNGKNLPRRTSCLRPLNHQQVCPFSFVVKFDDIGYYIELNKLSPIKAHCNHFPYKDGEMQMPKRLLTENQIELIRTINALNASALQICFSR